MTISVLHLLKELVGWVLITILLHLGQVALFWGDGSVHLQGSQGGEDEERKSLLSRLPHSESSRPFLK